MLPLAGAVAVIVNFEVPFGELTAIGAVSVTVQASSAPVALGIVPQSTAATLVPAVTAVADTPAGSWSAMTSVVPVAEVPLFPRLIV